VHRKLTEYRQSGHSSQITRALVSQVPFPRPNRSSVSLIEQIVSDTRIAYAPRPTSRTNKSRNGHPLPGLAPALPPEALRKRRRRSFEPRVLLCESSCEWQIRFLATHAPLPSGIELVLTRVNQRADRLCTDLLHRIFGAAPQFSTSVDQSRHGLWATLRPTPPVTSGSRSTHCSLASTRTPLRV